LQLEIKSYFAAALTRLAEEIPAKSANLNQVFSLELVRTIILACIRGLDLQEAKIRSKRNM
jgi:hypothetical protein